MAQIFFFDRVFFFVFVFQSFLIVFLSFSFLDMIIFSFLIFYSSLIFSAFRLAIAVFLCLIDGLDVWVLVGAFESMKSSE